VEEMWKSLEKQAREALKCWKQSLKADFDGAQKTRILTDMWKVKTVLVN
jgi:hypothetical protein